jgi:hypothetical protein
MHEAEARDDKEAMRALLRKQGGRLLETVRAPPGAAMSPFNPEHVEGDFLTDRATWQGLGPVHKDGTPHCWSCALGNLLTPATHLALDLKDGKEAPSWRFLCTKDQERWAESYPGVPVFEIRRPALDLGNVDEALPEGKPEPFRMVIYGRCLAANVEGGPLDGPHLQVEVPSTQYPWRMHLTEGSRSGHPAVWHLPLYQPLKGDRAYTGHPLFTTPHQDPREAGAFFGRAIRITLELDPDATL